jgi:uncharacterized integral membrane protein (TIGR00697 family)
MKRKNGKHAFPLFIILAGLFIASLVSCNLIFQKFFSWSPFEFLAFGSDVNSTWYYLTHYTFEISVGIIPYPLTFLVTDMISEIYGRKKANQVVVAGLISSIFVFGLILISDAVMATSWSPVGDEQYHQVFGRTGIAVLASMAAYLAAQFVDIRLFHFWKRLTKGKMLWVRNNFSTISSQFLDTFLVIALLTLFGVLDEKMFWLLILNGFLFKVIVALLDTPLFYLVTWWTRKHFNLKEMEELKIGD